MQVQPTAVFQRVPEGYVGFVDGLPGANTQGTTLEEARANLQEAVQPVLEANRALAEEELRGRTVIREPSSECSWRAAGAQAPGTSASVRPLWRRFVCVPRAVTARAIR